VLKLAENVLSLGLRGGLQSAANEAQVAEPQLGLNFAVHLFFCERSAQRGRAECCELIAFAAADGSIFFSVRACLKSGSESRLQRHVSDVWRVFDLIVVGQKAHVASGAFCRGHRRRARD